VDADFLLNGTVLKHYSFYIFPDGDTSTEIEGSWGIKSPVSLAVIGEVDSRESIIFEVGLGRQVSLSLVVRQIVFGFFEFSDSGNKKIVDH
jgi:hypothetical protein